MSWTLALGFVAGVVFCVFWAAVFVQFMIDTDPCPKLYSQEFYNDTDLRKRCECVANQSYFECLRPER